MAERRMFAKTIVTSDAFLDMPLSARCLYFTLGMFADDDGFVNNPKSIMRQTGASIDDLNILLAKKFVISFESGVIVIKHWKINNYLRNDRYQETKYLDEKKQLSVDKNGSYVLGGIPAVYQVDTQDSIGKDSIDKDSIDIICEVSETVTTQKDEVFIKLILNDNSYYDLSKNIVNQYIELYKAVDVEQEIRNASAWLISNPNRRKTRRGILRFLNIWLEKKQNSGGNFNQKQNQPQNTQTYANHNYTKEQLSSVFDDLDDVKI